MLTWRETLFSYHKTWQIITCKKLLPNYSYGQAEVNKLGRERRLPKIHICIWKEKCKKASANFSSWSVQVIALLPTETAVDHICSPLFTTKMRGERTFIVVKEKGLWKKERKSAVPSWRPLYSRTVVQSYSTHTHIHQSNTNFDYQLLPTTGAI